MDREQESSYTKVVAVADSAVGSRTQVEVVGCSDPVESCWAAYSVHLQRCYCYYIPHTPCPYHHPSGYLLEARIPVLLVIQRSFP